MPSSRTSVLGGKKSWWAWAIGTFFGVGLLSPGPGTYGSVAAVLVWFVIARHVAPGALPAATICLAVVATLIGIPAATLVAQQSGRKDPQIVVIDEVAGQWIALVFCVPTMPLAMLALLCFRLFDIWKPPPIRRLEKLPNGTGVVVDDLCAGLYALVLHTALQHLWITYHLLHGSTAK